jgi:uncharacterized protein
MARPEKNRKVGSPPLMKGFKPYGIPMCKIETIRLSFEEYESVRLVNYEMMMQESAAELMNISRPTLTRIYNKALKTIARAFIEGKAIEIEGGNYELEDDWYRCRKCFKLIQGMENHVKCKDCPVYNKNELVNLSKPVK